MNHVLPLLAPALRPERRAEAVAAAETAFTAVRIEGGLFPAEFLQRIAAATASGQSGEDYAVPPGRTLRDEIGRYWTIAEALWKEYRRNRPRADLPAERTGVERWLVRLLRDVFGHADVVPAAARAAVGERGFPITHRCHGGAVPLLLTVAERDLDRTPPSATRGAAVPRTRRCKNISTPTRRRCGTWSPTAPACGCCATTPP